MRLVDARRLTGPNHLSRAPLVIVEVALDAGDTAEDVRAVYARELDRMLHALGLPENPPMMTRLHRGGAVFGYEAPIDQMLACAEASEWAVLSAIEMRASREALPLEPKRSEIEAILLRDRNPGLLGLAAEAKRRGLPFLWDDADVSIGAGRGSVCFPVGAVPELGAVSWPLLGTIPIALVTGTNGKTTSSRLLARVATEAGLRVAITSTGGSAIGTSIIEDGDCTGPGSARVVLRRADVELAVLETARGGILRRGLAVDTCDAALITNVSDDHLGLYGIDDVAGMVRVKGVVAQAVSPSGTVILNARDANLVTFAGELACNVTFFADLEGLAGSARDAACAVIADHRARGERVVFTEGGTIVSARGASAGDALASVGDLPITFGGAARYNVENVLGVVATAEALGLPREAIVRALSAFSMDDNPGRGQVVVRQGVTVLVDFGHNPEGVRAVMQLVEALRRGANGKLTVVTGSPGDRTDAEIEEIAANIAEARPDRVFVRELLDYLRGRAPGDVPALFRRSLLAHGLPAGAFVMVASEVDALERAFADAVPGDLIAVLVHLDTSEVKAFLDAAR